MKNSFRLLSLLLAVAFIALSLCSCQELDNMKANRALYNDDRSEITFHDNIYKMINPGKFDFIDNATVNWDSKYATTSDIPVLLANSYGDYMQVYKDEIMLRVSGYVKDFAATSDESRVGKDDLPSYSEDSYRNYYYVRADKYDEVKKTISDAKLDHYYFEYWSDDYDDAEYAYEEYSKSIPYAGGSQHQVLLSDELTAAVDKAMNAALNDKVSYKVLGTGDYDVKEIFLNPCDRNMILTQSTGQCYLLEDRGQYYFWDGNYYQEYSIVPFSEEESVLVKELFDQYPDAADYNDITWQFTDLTGTVEIDETPEPAVKETGDSAGLNYYCISYYPDTVYSASYQGMEAAPYDTDHVSTILLDQDVTDAINGALATPAGDRVQLTEERLQSADALLLERCDKDMKVTSSDNSVVLLRYGERCFVVDDSYDSQNTVCPVDQDGAALIKALFDKYPEAADQTAF